MKIYKNNQWQDYKFEVSVPNFSGASSSVAGVSGLVPAPSAGSSTRYLSANGAWQDLPTIPDTSSFAQTGVANIWGSLQTFNAGVKIGGLEQYSAYTDGTGTVCAPDQSFVYDKATGTYTLNLMILTKYYLAADHAMVVTALITSDSDCALMFSGIDVIRYIGSASDIAIKAPGILLNILLYKTTINSAVKTIGVIQATALSES